MPEWVKNADIRNCWARMGVQLSNRLMGWVATGDARKPIELARVIAIALHAS